MHNTLAVLVVMMLLLPGSAQAQRAKVTRHGVGANVSLGYGSAKADCGGCGTDSEAGMAGDLSIGAYVRPTFFLGAELSAWRHSEGNVVETIAHILGAARWYPAADRPLFLKAGLGLRRYSASDDPDEFTGSAAAFAVGGGYDIAVRTDISITPYLDYLTSAHGTVKMNGVTSPSKLSTRMLKAGVGVTFH